MCWNVIPGTCLNDLVPSFSSSSNTGIDYSSNFWMPASDDTQPWIQASLASIHRLNELMTVSSSAPDGYAFHVRYSVDSRDGAVWTWVYGERCSAAARTEKSESVSHTEKQMPDVVW